MTKEEKRKIFFDMQDHAEKYSDDEIQKLLKDEEMKDFFCDMSATKRAVIKDNLEVSAQSLTDSEWIKFKHAHIKKNNSHNWMKIAATLIGIIFLSGAAFAFAIHIGMIKNPFSAKEPVRIMQHQATQNGVRTNTKIKEETVRTDTTNTKSITFDQAELGQIISEMSAYYHVKSKFNNNTTQHIRLYFVWNKQEGLQRNIEILNGFDRINITYENGIIIIE